YLFDGFAPRYATSVAVTVIPFALLIYAAASTDLDGKPSFLRHRWLIRLGEWSYCFYLFHDLLLSQVTKFLQRHHDLVLQPHVAAVPRNAAIAAAAVGLSLVVTIILSGLVYHFWERPFEKRIRGAGPVRATSVI
ncbi:MAG TPA: hypothetical protein VHX67_04175, partial [Acidimicrobiales bacterium]|nr:hypothetical protein [Acidimicrobiales bacterium]